MNTGHPPWARVELPSPPGINQQDVTIHGRRVRNWAGRADRQQVSPAVAGFRASAGIAGDLVAAVRHACMALFMDFTFPRPPRRDLDGCRKIAPDPIFDALEFNDTRVVDVRLVMRPDSRHQRIEVGLDAIAERDVDVQHVYWGSGQGIP